MAPFISTSGSRIISDPLGNEPNCCNWFQKGVKWFNKYLNPLVVVAEFVTGKSLDSDFKEDKSRAESGTGIVMFALPVAKVESVIVNEAKNIIVNQIEKLAAKKIVKKAGKDLVKTEVTLARKGALNEAKRDLGIPKSQHPDKLPNGKQFETVKITDRNGKTILNAEGNL